MSARMRILRKIAVGVAILVAVCVIAAILLVQTSWFRTQVRQKVITAVEDGTGGRVDIGSFSFNWTHLHVVFTNFVVHGSEPPGAAPYLSARRIDIGLRFFANGKPLDVASLQIDRPEANILVAADGSTNVPRPKHPSTSNTSPLQTVVDLAVGHFDLNNGAVTFNSRTQNIDLHGDRLHVELWYDVPKQGYRGEIAFAPVYVVSGKNQPVDLRITLPVSIERDRIAFQNARIATARSQLSIDGSIENLQNPKTSAHIAGQVALADVKDLANLPLDLGARGVPSSVALDVNATVAANNIDVAGSRVAVGASFIEASGKLRDPAGNGRLRFHSHFALAELGRLTKLAARPAGNADIDGTATMDAARNYDVLAQVRAAGVSFQQGARRISNVSLSSPVHLTPVRLDLPGFRVDAVGGEVTGDASLADFSRYTLAARLRHLDLRRAARELAGSNIAYSGVVSGPLAAAGDTKVPGVRSLTARANLSIAPGGGGIPVTGRLNADYNGESGNVAVASSYIALPHTRLAFDGSLNRRINVAFTSRDLRDLSPLTGSAPPVTLSGGPATFTGSLTGSLAAPAVAGHLSLNRFAMEGRLFDGLDADLAASSSHAAISSGSLRRGAMQTSFSGAVGLRHWGPTPNQPLNAQASIRSADLADVLALAGVAPQGDSGALNADVNIAGTVGNPSGSADLNVNHGSIRGEPFDLVQARATVADGLVAIPDARIAQGNERVDLTAEFRHPPGRFNTGQLHAHVATTPIELAQLHAVQAWRQDTSGVLQLTADLTGDLRGSPTPDASDPKFQPTNISLDASAHGLTFGGQNYGDFTASARTQRQAVNYTVSSDFAGSRIHLAGGTQLAPGYPTNADATISGLPIDRVVMLARVNLPARGTLGATLHYSGTTDRPQGTLDLTVSRGLFYDEPVDSAHLRVNYQTAGVDVQQFEVRSGPSVIALEAGYDHPAGDLQSGNLQFRITSGHVDLARIRNVQKLRPGLAGIINLTGNGAAEVRNGQPRLQVRDVSLDLAAKGLAAQGKKLGDLTLTANSSQGSVRFALDSDLGGASLHGRGNAQFGGDYPVHARLTFQNVAWKGLQPLLSSEGSAPLPFDASADGQLTVNGPVLRADNLNGTLQLSRLQFTAEPDPASQGQPVEIKNQGAIALALDHGTVHIQSLHLSGPETDVQAGGDVSLAARTMHATVSAHTDLAIARRLNRRVISSGQVEADATLRGTFDKPLINGKVQLQKASMHFLNLPTGLSDAEGVIQFNGNGAVLRNVTGNVGGGKVTLGGNLSYSDLLRFQLHLNARSVRLLPQPGISVVINSDLRLSGRSTASILSGTVTIDQVTYAPQSDLGSILARSMTPVSSTPNPSQILENMKLDVQVRTAPGMAVQASVAESLQANADLHVQGTASRPGLLGRVDITEGKLYFFSSNYTVNSGIISFYNPVRIDPILNLSLETQTKGVDVVLHVTGPVDNMKLTYTSDPPLPFQEIVALLATGKVPTSDPNLLANQPSQPPQSFQQMGESAILSTTLADPIANRLQRVFGITQLKIDPSFAGSSDLPQATVALQQKVTNAVTLTYMTAVDNPSTEVISGEWDFNRQWSATATRDEYGIVSIMIMYKRHLH